MLSQKIKFFLQGLKNFKEIGTVTRSGPAMCRKIAFLVPADSEFVIELGAGDGVITRHILRKLGPDAKLISFEINPGLYRSLNAINDERLIAINDSAEKMKEYLAKYNIVSADAIVCAIPFIVMKEEVMYSILEDCKDVLKSNHNYLQVHYGKNLEDKYRHFFGNLTIHKIIRNLPPAYVFQCIKE